jgi:hypothetical protein
LEPQSNDAARAVDVEAHLGSADPPQLPAEPFAQCAAPRTGRRATSGLSAGSRSSGACT